MGGDEEIGDKVGRRQVRALVSLALARSIPDIMGLSLKIGGALLAFVGAVCWPSDRVCLELAK